MKSDWLKRLTDQRANLPGQVLSPVLQAFAVRQGEADTAVVEQPSADLAFGSQWFDAQLQHEPVHVPAEPVPRAPLHPFFAASFDELESALFLSQLANEPFPSLGPLSFSFLLPVFTCVRERERGREAIRSRDIRKAPINSPARAGVVSGDLHGAY